MSSESSINIQFIDLDDYRLAVHVSHNPIGTGHLILLHGAGVASESTWYPMLSAFQSYRRILCPDLRGMGRSHAFDFEDHPITAEAVADDIGDLLTEFSVTCCQMLATALGV